MSKFRVNQKLLKSKNWGHCIAILPAILFVIDFFNKPFIAEPAEKIMHFTGELALQLLIITVLIGVVKYYFNIKFMLAWRKIIGLWAFFYATLHLLAFLIFEVAFDLQNLLRSLLTLEYIYFGILAFIILLLMAITSNRTAVLKLKKNWKLLHNFIYLALLAIIIHIALQIKSGFIDVAIYALIVLVLIIMKLRGVRKLRIKN